MARFERGKSGNPNGRPKGSKNKLTELKDAYLGVFDGLGGQKGLKEWVEAHPRNKTAFYGWLTKMLPANVQVDHDGAIDITVRVKEAENGKGLGNGE